MIEVSPLAFPAEPAWWSEGSRDTAIVLGLLCVALLEPNHFSLNEKGRVFRFFGRWGCLLSLEEKCGVNSEPSALALLALSQSLGRRRSYRDGTEDWGAALNGINFLVCFYVSGFSFLFGSQVHVLLLKAKSQ